MTDASAQQPDALQPGAPQPGDEIRFSRTIAECDVHAFAGLTGDFAPAHMDAARMRRSVFGQRVVHGALLVGLMSAASTEVAGRFGLGEGAEILLSLGYDRIRFTAPVFIGETVTVHYRITEADPARRRYHAEVTITDESGAVVAHAINILAWSRGRPRTASLP